MRHPIVFIHGSGDNARIWRLQNEYFGGELAFAIDLPGHGQRADRFSESVSVLDYAQAAQEIITQELHLTSPIIAGHSLGGAIALTMGLEYGPTLGGLLLIGTGARLRVHPDLLASARQSPQSASVQIGQLAVASANSATILQSLQQEQVSSGSSMLYRDLAACNIFDIMDRLHEITIPTLIICGANDRLTPVKYSQFLQQHISGSVLRIIPGAGHYVMREQPEAVHQAIEEWMQESN